MVPWTWTRAGLAPPPGCWRRHSRDRCARGCRPRTAQRRRRPRRRRPAHEAAASPPLVSQSTTVRRPASAARGTQLQRVVGVVLPARRRSARRRRPRACPARGGRSIDSAIMRRFSSRSTPQHLAGRAGPTSCRRWRRWESKSRPAHAGTRRSRPRRPGAGRAEGDELRVHEPLVAHPPGRTRSPWVKLAV